MKSIHFSDKLNKILNVNVVNNAWHNLVFSKVWCFDFSFQMAQKNQIPTQQDYVVSNVL